MSTSNSDASADWDCDGGELIDEFCEWYNSLDDLSELPVSRAVREAEILFQADSNSHWYRTRALHKGAFQCQCVHIYDQSLCRHVWVSRALASDLREDLELRYLASPPVVLDTWIQTEDYRPDWLRYPPGRVVSRPSPAWNIVPLYTSLALDPENIAKKLAIINWCSGVEPDLHYWAVRFAAP